mgnify:CR=1 FL=1
MRSNAKDGQRLAISLRFLLSFVISGTVIAICGGRPATAETPVTSYSVSDEDTSLIVVPKELLQAYDEPQVDKRYAYWDRYVMRTSTLYQQPEVEPSIEDAPQVDLPTDTTELSASFGASPEAILASLSAERRSIASTVSSDTVLGLESTILATTDTGNLLSKSNSVLGVASEHRTPIVTYNVARGRHVGQQTGSGSYWFPARADLDTLLSKLDSGIIQDVIVIKGPYSASYGPGLAFYDVKLRDAERFPCGPEKHFSSKLEWKENGDQWYARESFWGGGEDYGWRISYGDRSGSDYRTGRSSFEMPTSYNSRDWDVAYGKDLGCGKTIDFHYLRLDQTDVEFPGQMYDMDYLVTNAAEVTYIDECSCYYDRLEVEGWYNRTTFAGDNRRSGKRRQIPSLDNATIDLGVGGPQTAQFFGDTDVYSDSSGYKAFVSWGCEERCLLTVGTDLRHLTQELNERNYLQNLVPMGIPGPIPFANNQIPDSHSTNPGLFAELQRPWDECTTLKVGSRFDFVQMDSDQTEAGTVGLPQFYSPHGDLQREFNMFSAFVTAERQLDCNWTADIGAGYAMRPPTMTEMYANNPFIAALPQLVFTRILGNPDLDEEQMWQVDAGLTGNFCGFRCGSHGFYSWVRDYITYDHDAGSFNALNTPRATLVGGEAYGEYDLNCCWTAFSTVSYVEGVDRTRNDTIGPRRTTAGLGTDRSGAVGDEEALPVIPPMNGRVGLRWHDPCPDQRWAVEFAAQIWDDQSQVANTLLERPTPGYTVCDIRAFYRANECMTWTIGVENLTNKFYQNHFDPKVNPTSTLGVFQPGTMFYTGFEWTN